MASIDLSAITLTGKDSNSTPGTLQTTRFDQSDRLKRALQRLGFFWLLAGITIFIPLAHFVLVPGFFIAGPVIAYMTYQTHWVRNHAAGVCPTCQQEIQLSLDARDQLPKWTYCPTCNAPLHLTEAGDTSTDTAAPNTP
ncbi:MAG: hypothetical protein GXP17_11785 [Gammaproteobacteria bacterium]|nr:hypothetical protein [Gammaproteobacteria bacterium]